MAIPSMHYDVAIVGFGPAGALAANLLGRQGHHVIVLDKETSIYPLPRAMHFDAEVMRIYQAAGLAEQIAPIVVPTQGCQFLTNKHQLMFRAISDLASEPYGWPQRLLFRQPQLEEILRANACKYPNVAVQLGQEVIAYTQDDTGVTVISQRADGTQHQITARYLLGCDGASSVIRRISGIQYQRMAEFKQPWLIVDTLINHEDLPLPDMMTQICDPLRPTTFIPRLGTCERRWEFFLHEGESAEEMQQPEQVRALLRSWIDPDLVTIERTAVYTSRALIAERWRDGRVFLIGDAAHLMPPFTGQGLCSGARDAHNIAWKLDLVLHGHAAPAFLDTYEQERSVHVQAVTRMSIIAGTFIMERHPILQWLRDYSITKMSRSPLLNREVSLPGLYQGLLLYGTPAAGERFIQPHVTLPESSVPVRLDDVLGDHFAIIAIQTDPREQLESGTVDYWKHLGTYFIQVLPKGQAFPTTSPPGIQLVRDDTGELAAWFAHYRRVAVILRPDRYVFGTFDSPKSVTCALRDALRPPSRNVVWQRINHKVQWLIGSVLSIVALISYRSSAKKR